MTLHKIKRSKSPQKRKIERKKSPSLEEIIEELEKLKKFLRLRESTLDVVGIELSGITRGKASTPKINGEDV